MHQALYCLILHVSHCSDVSGWDHMSHVLMCQDETTCLMFWCVRMRPHVLHCSDALGWDHISHRSDASGRDHMSHIVLMYQDETTCLTLFWCIRTRLHVWHCSDAWGWDHMSHVLMLGMRPRLTSQPPPLSCYCAHQSAQSSSVCHDVSLITFVLCGMRPSCNDYCTLCFQNAFVLFTVYALAFYVFLGYAVW